MIEGRCALQDCERPFAYDPKDLRGSFFPFCSARCKGVDLGNWVNEEYRIPGAPAPGAIPMPAPLPEDAEGPEEFVPEDEDA